MLIGGVRTPSDALVGPVADQVLRSLHFDVAFLGCHGCRRSASRRPNLGEAETNRASSARPGRLVVVADSTSGARSG